MIMDRQNNEMEQFDTKEEWHKKGEIYGINVIASFLNDMTKILIILLLATKKRIALSVTDDKGVYHSLGKVFPKVLIKHIAKFIFDEYFVKSLTRDLLCYFAKETEEQMVDEWNNGPQRILRNWSANVSLTREQTVENIGIFGQNMRDLLEHVKSKERKILFIIEKVERPLVFLKNIFQAFYENKKRKRDQN